MNDIERRSLIFGVSAAGLLTTQLFRNSPVSAAGGIEIRHDARIVKRFDSTFSAAMPWAAPGMLSISGAAALMRNARIEVVWDNRLASAGSDKIFATAGNLVHELTGHIASKGNRSTLTIALRSLSGLLHQRSLVQVSPQVFVLSNLSDLGFDDVTETSVRLIGKAGKALSRAPKTVASRQAPATGEAWGGEISVIWDGGSATGQADQFSGPLVVVLESSGPGQIPAGSRVVVTADAPSIGSLRCASAKLNEVKDFRIHAESGTRAGNLATLVITTSAPIAAGDRVRFLLDTSKDAVGPPSDRERSACVVSFEVDAADQEMQKTTGNEVRALTS